MLLGVSDVINIPLVFGGLGEPVPPIESVRWAIAQRAKMNWHLTGIGLRKEMTKDVRANATGLTARMDVKVVQVKAIAGGMERVEADTLTVEDDELTVLRMERLAEALARSLWVEAPDTLQTVAHRSDTKGYKLVEICQGHDGKCDAG